MKYLYTSLILFLLLSCKSVSNIVILHNDSKIAYEGRIGENESKTSSEIYWAGSSVKINFEGTTLTAILEDENGTNFFNVIIDNDTSSVLKLNKGKHTYKLAENLEYGKHTVQLIKRNDWTYGTTLFYGFELVGNEFLSKNQEKELLIEFYGDSITVGHGNEDYTVGKDSSYGDVSNNYNTYAAMTARALNAEYSCIARSGIGIMVSWFNMIMPEMYNRLNPNDSISKWDFSKKQVNIVVINLFQNDSWIVNRPEHVEFKRRFGTEKPTEQYIVDSYKSFIEKIRDDYPNASIVCLLGNMDVTKENSKWPDYVSKAVEKLDDKNMFTCFVPFKKTKEHPKVEDHKIIADKLLKLIESKIIN